MTAAQNTPAVPVSTPVDSHEHGRRAYPVLPHRLNGDGGGPHLTLEDDLGPILARVAAMADVLMDFMDSPTFSQRSAERLCESIELEIRDAKAALDVWGTAWRREAGLLRPESAA